MKRYIRSQSDVSKAPWKDPEVKYVANVGGYQVYRKIENGRGKWFAHWQEDPVETMFPITYDQALGYEPMPARSSIDQLRQYVSKSLFCNTGNNLFDDETLEILRRINERGDTSWAEINEDYYQDDADRAYHRGKYQGNY